MFNQRTTIIGLVNIWLRKIGQGYASNQLMPIRSKNIRHL